MKTAILFCSILLASLPASAQADISGKGDKNSPVRTLTTEPALGLEPMSDLIISNLVQWNLKKHFSLVSYTSYAYNNALQRTFNHIKTDYNYAISQKFGIGVSLYTRHASHTLSIMSGIRYDAFRETLDNPDFEKVSASVSSISPDHGLMYNIKIGKKKYFFSCRMFMPLYPYPFKSSDVWSLSDNMSNLSLEFGLGIRLK